MQETSGRFSVTKREGSSPLSSSTSFFFFFFTSPFSYERTGRDFLPARLNRRAVIRVNDDVSNGGLSEASLNVSSLQIESIQRTTPVLFFVFFKTIKRIILDD